LSRWMPEGTSLEDMRASLEAYEVMRPKSDNIKDTYVAETKNFNDLFLSSFGSGSGSGSH
jgi:hypothetical protein